MFKFIQKKRRFSKMILFYFIELRSISINKEAGIVSRGGTPAFFGKDWQA
jgi:hypothetical protein